MILKQLVRPLVPRKARRALRRWLLSQLGAPLSSPDQANPSGVPSAVILDKRLLDVVPSPQVALDIFKGYWVSKPPKEFPTLEAGSTPLFDDERLGLAAPHIGGVAQKTVLDLGTLEGGNAYLLEKMKARSVVAVEANGLHYLKCLVMKEVLGMSATRFLCGNALEYLRATNENFDVCLAAGLLYHMEDPIDLLELISRRARHTIIWTHYVDTQNQARNKIEFYGQSSREFRGRTYAYHRQEYGYGFTGNTYCGGIVPHSHWMPKQDLLAALEATGYRKVHVVSDTDTVSGPAILLAGSQG